MAKTINYDNLIKNLPDAFAKSEDSNNYKLLKIVEDVSEKTKSDLTGMDDLHNIANAYGKTLDYWYGEKLQLKRGSSDDTQYRIRLIGKIMQNTSDGTYSSIVGALAQILQCLESDIHIVEGDTANTIVIADIPLKVLYDANFTSDEIISLIESILAVGVTIETANFTGTFEFSDIEDDYDEDTGFADDEQTIGGYLGLLA